MGMLHPAAKSCRQRMRLNLFSVALRHRHGTADQSMRPRGLQILRYSLTSADVSDRQLVANGNLEEFVANQEESSNALGEEIADVFDLELGI